VINEWKHTCTSEVCQTVSLFSFLQEVFHMAPMQNFFCPSGPRGALQNVGLLYVPIYIGILAHLTGK